MIGSDPSEPRIPLEQALGTNVRGKGVGNMALGRRHGWLPRRSQAFRWFCTSWRSVGKNYRLDSPTIHFWAVIFFGGYKDGLDMSPLQIIRFQSTE